MLGYSFRFVGGAENIYVFATKQQSVYEVSFRSSSYIFPKHPNFSDDVFEFVIALQGGSRDRLPVSDPLVAGTIIKIFQDFFARRGAVAVYICDSSDNRQATRSRLFDRWYQQYRHLGFLKLDSMFLDPQGTIYTSIVTHKLYPYKEEVMSAFLQLTEETNAGK